MSYDSTAVPTTDKVVAGVVATSGGELQLQRLDPSVIARNEFSVNVQGGYELRWNTGHLVPTSVDLQNVYLEAYALSRASRAAPLDFLWSAGVSANTSVPLSLPATSGPIVIAAIPEPTGLALAAVVLVPLLRRRPRD